MVVNKVISRLVVVGFLLCLYSSTLAMQEPQESTAEETISLIIDEPEVQPPLPPSLGDCIPPFNESNNSYTYSETPTTPENTGHGTTLTERIESNSVTYSNDGFTRVTTTLLRLNTYTEELVGYGVIATLDKKYTKLTEDVDYYSCESMEYIRQLSKFEENTDFLSKSRTTEESGLFSTDRYNETFRVTTANPGTATGQTEYYYLKDENGDSILPSSIGGLSYTHYEYTTTGNGVNRFIKNGFQRVDSIVGGQCTGGVHTDTIDNVVQPPRSVECGM